MTAAAAALLAICAMVVAARSPSAEARAAAIRANGSAALVGNSKNGRAILSGRLGPGDAVAGSVTIANVGSAPGSFTLSLSHLVNRPGTTRLSARLDLAVDDITRPTVPVAVYRGKLGALTPRALGTFSPGDSRVYRFTVSWADAGLADAPYIGSSMSVEFDWSTPQPATQAPPPPPQTTAPEPRLAAPTLGLRIAKRQRVLRRRAVLARVRCDVACTANMSASLALAGSRHAIKLGGVHRKLAAGVEGSLKLRLPKTRRGRMSRALHTHRRPSVKVSIWATGPGGRSARIRRTVRVVG